MEKELIERVKSEHVGKWIGLEEGWGSMANYIVSSSSPHSPCRYLFTGE